MNLIELISSVSKVAIGAFVITLAVVGYEVFLLMKRKQGEQIKEDKNISIPDFDKTHVTQGTFSPIAVDPSASQPVDIQSRKVSRPFLAMLLGLVALIILISGFLIYKRNQVSQRRAEVSPIAGKGTITPSVTSALPTRAPTIEPTEGLQPTLVPTSAVLVTGSVTPGTTSTVTTTPSVTVIASAPTATGSVTSAPTSSELPQAGSYQMTLIISVVAIAIIYLALIL